MPKKPREELVYLDNGFRTSPCPMFECLVGNIFIENSFSVYVIKFNSVFSCLQVNSWNGNDYEVPPNSKSHHKGNVMFLTLGLLFFFNLFINPVKSSVHYTLKLIKTD